MNDPVDFPGPLSRDLTELEAFEAMRLFLEAHWERGLRASDDLGGLLGDLSRPDADREPMDPAQWDEWLNAIVKVKAQREHGSI